MKIFKNQCIAGTKIDRQGEKVPIDFLVDFVERSKDRKISLNQFHDFGKKSPGYMINVRLVKDKEENDEYSLIADVYCETEDLEKSVGGFSISYTEIISENKEGHEILFYLPFPYYNDEILVNEFAKQDNVSVGKWVKKATDPATTALIGAAIIAVLQPAWNDLYKTSIAPIIHSFIKQNHKLLESNNISTNLVQTVSYQGKDIQVILIPNRKAELQSYSPDCLDKAMFDVNEFLKGNDNPQEVFRITMYFHENNAEFKIHKSENENGDVVHYA